MISIYANKYIIWNNYLSLKVVVNSNVLYVLSFSVKEAWDLLLKTS